MKFILIMLTAFLSVTCVLGAPVAPSTGTAVAPTSASASSSVSVPPTKPTPPPPTSVQNQPSKTSTASCPTPTKKATGVAGFFEGIKNGLVGFGKKIANFFQETTKRNRRLHVQPQLAARTVQVAQPAQATQKVRKRARVRFQRKRKTSEQVS
ncbi:hypothetical protein BDQ17DRAFT_998270 [Cyathus striatus]|nr:hypothetical protein BDQ17DRAFT_998270 [Cyathus striatus]